METFSPQGGKFFGRVTGDPDAAHLRAQRAQLAASPPRLYKTPPTKQ